MHIGSLAAILLFVSFGGGAWAAGQSSSAGSKSAEPRGRHCYDVQVERPKQAKDPNKITGTALGAVAGGLLGHQVGDGRGKKLATVAGAVGGALAGRKIQEHRQKQTETVIERRCD